MTDSENPDLIAPSELMALVDIQFDERTPTRVTARGQVRLQNVRA